MSKKIEELPTLDPADYNPEEDLILIEKSTGGTFCTTSQAIFESQRSEQSSFINFFKTPKTLATITAEDVANQSKQYNVQSSGVPHTAKYVLIHFVETSIHADSSPKYLVFNADAISDNFYYRRTYNPNPKKSNNSPHRWTDTHWFHIQSDGTIKISYHDCRHFTIDIELIAYS
jgi:hypothetical protein